MASAEHVKSPAPRRLERTPARRSRQGIEEVQRARMLAAALRVVHEHGYGGMSVARVTSRAGVSRRTFYEIFDDREDCFLALLHDAVTRATHIANDAVTTITTTGRAGWRERVRTGLLALLRLAEDEPAVGSLLVVDALGGGARVLAHRAHTLTTLSNIIDEGRSHTRAGHKPPPLTAEGIIGAVLSVIHARLLARAAPPLTANGAPRSPRAPAPPLAELLNPLMGMIVLPYLGQAAATNELARPTPDPPAKDPRAATRGATTTTTPTDPLAGLHMRLTHRTLLVLAAIATQPGASNRQIADAAGIHDQGQISKLLTRLERIGLTHNTNTGQPQGQPNAWTLTPHGTQVQTALAL